MSSENQNNQQISFLDQMGLEITYIRSFLLNSYDKDTKEQYVELEKTYSFIHQQVEQSQLEDKKAVQVYGSFLKELKKFKRKTENQIKFKKRDVDAFRKKQEMTGQHLIPVFHDIKMNVTEYMDKFDINKLIDPNFQMHLYTCEELCEIAFKCFDHTKFMQNNNIDPSVVKNLIKTLCLNYNVIPYHNWTHAFSLFQLLFTCYYSSDLQEFFEPIELFSALFAALAHDLNHKGVNNLYKVKKRSEKALTYCDQAVLENMHASTYFRILNDNPSIDVSRQFQDQNQVAHFKKIALTSILATDMGKHNKLVEKIQNRGQATIRVRNNPQGASELDQHLALKSHEPEDRRLVINIMVHACDIGNPCLQYNNYMNWSYLLAQEFNDQTLKEAKKNVPVTGFLQYKDKQSYYGGQIFFCKQLCLPLWEQIGQVWPKLEHLPNEQKKNIQIIEEELKKIKSK